MSGFAQVFLLELRLRRAVFAAALVAGIIPIPMAWIMSRNFAFSEALNAGAFAFALIGGELLALYLGATVLCKDLSEARSGFFFSRPLSGLALWAGKISAAWAVVLGAMLVCLLPATLMGRGLASLRSPENPFWNHDLGPQVLSPLWVPLLVAMAALLFMAFAHAASVMRFNSPWIILDVVMVVLLPALAWWAIRRVLTFQTPLLFLVLVFFFAVSLLMGLLSAGAVQTVVGRADLRRGHRVLSLALWAILTGCVLAADGYALWATSFSPADLSRIGSVKTAQAGPWVLIEGGLKHRGPYAWTSFLVNTQTRAYRSVGGTQWGSEVVFSPDGRLAVAAETPFAFNNGPSELVSYDLSGPGIPQPGRHAITVSSAWDSRITFSPDSSRLAVFSDETLSVYDLPSWKLVAAQRLGSLPTSKGSPRFLFLDRDRLRVLKEGAGVPGPPQEGTLILEFDVVQKRLQQTGRVTVEPHLLRWDSTGGRMLAVFRQDSASQVALCDARTGAVLKTLTEWGPRLPVASFLGDGRILVARREDAQSFLRLYSSEGELQRTCTLSGSRILVAGPEVRGGKVVIETWERRAKQIDGKDIRLFDPATGDLQVIPGLRPSHSWWVNEGAPAGPAGGVTSWAFPNEKGQLVRYDFQTGKATPVKF